MYSLFDTLHHNDVTSYTLLFLQILQELTNVLHDLQKDDKCRIVLVTSTGSSFCQGIDLQALVNADAKERSKVVNEYVHALT